MIVGFDPRPVHVGILVQKVAMGRGFLVVPPFSPVAIIPPKSHTHMITHHRRDIILSVKSSGR